ncbi:MAG: bifunctional riboflavin kinase/FAD synthetase [Acidobacteriales bacterium]|nr:bifunctional riboflavin kinase/FAD synthetase [Candidatus Koribacter versatilis]MBI3647135.1 bifunctional riboflavin kinase/FAD synthetase [Terriglobales bacterium]
MHVFHKLADVPADFGPAIVSVGNFDGVHRAHRFVLSEIVARAKARQARSMAVTFEPHPIRILRPDHNLKLLTPTPEKILLLAETGIDAVLLLPFTRDLSLMTPHHFAHEILKKRLHACEVHEGYNFHFGHKASGNIQTLCELGREMGFEVHDYPEMRLRGEPVSSSHIRKLLRDGRVSRARHLLARPFSILSTAGRGRGYGSKYTVPTINLARYEELAPKDGVYITRTRVGNEGFDSVTNIGNRPTFGADLFAVESHLLNFHPLEVTAETEIEIHFLDRLRDEIKFPSVDALREQIGRDVAKAQKYFRRLGVRRG